MYCPSCGRMNREEYARCIYCGAVLEDNTVQQQYPQVNTDQIRRVTQDVVNKTVQKVRTFDRSKVQNLPKKTKRTIIAAAAVVAVFVVFLIAGTSLTNPERVAVKYFKSYAEGDYSAMYSCLATVDSPFITKNTFVQYMSAQNDHVIGRIESYEVYETSEMISDALENYFDYKSDKKSSSLTKEYVISYISSGSGSSDTFRVTLARQKSKKLLFFKQYKVGIAQYLAENVQFLVPQGAVLSVDDIVLKDGVASQEQEGMQKYTVSYMFSGSHTVKVTGGLYQETTDTINVYSGSTETIRPEISESQKQVLASRTESVLRTMCAGAMAGKSFSALGLTDCGEDVADDYTDLSESLRNSDGTGYTSLTLTSFTTDSVNRDGEAYECNLRFEFTYVRLNKGWGGETYQDVSESPRSGNVSAAYVYDASASAWKLISFYTRSF